MNATDHKCRVCDALVPNAGLGTTCGTCGVRVTAEFETIRQSRPSSLVLLAAGAGLFAIAAREVQFGQWEAHQILTLGLCVLVTWYFVSNRPNEVVLWEKGVVLIECGNSPRLIGWEGVAAVQSNPQANRVEFIDAADSVVDSIPVEFLGTWRRAERFVEATNPYIDSVGTTETSTRA